jgi:hypothetical protein
MRRTPCEAGRRRTLEPVPPARHAASDQRFTDKFSRFPIVHDPWNVDTWSVNRSECQARFGWSRVQS